ncbi:MAG: leucyl/phenylalanyl-tRNA--protein transferase [Pseudomonadota bacterium]|nr:leucyl/phenylalanyl-tRNA--protein transferase [Pseudomonadota bacterium]
MIHWLRGPDDPLPSTGLALPLGSDAPGLLAAGGHPTPERLTEAYSRGIFPWYSEGQPVLWWSPDPRMVLLTQDFSVSRSLRKTIRRFAADARCEIRVDSAFRSVVEACATTPRQGQEGTWIVPEMIEAYCGWHAQGRAHSFETWIDGRLLGGLYGIGLGRMFFGESMFAHRTDASKIALAALVCFCRAHGVTMIDCQQHTSHLASMGARELRRPEFEARLAHAVTAPPISDWTYDLGLWQRLADTPAEDAGP